MTSSELLYARGTNADAEWMNYNLGPLWQSGSQSGWEHTTGQNTWKRPVYLFKDDDEGPSTAAEFEVQFTPGTANVVHAVATIKGAEIGHRDPTA